MYGNLQVVSLLPPQPPEKRINYTTVTNTAGNSILVVGVVLNEGASGATPTELQFTVNIPKTGFYNFILRYKVGNQVPSFQDYLCYVYDLMSNTLDLYYTIGRNLELVKLAETTGGTCSLYCNG